MVIDPSYSVRAATSGSDTFVQSNMGCLVYYSCKDNDNSVRDSVGDAAGCFDSFNYLPSQFGPTPD